MGLAALCILIFHLYIPFTNLQLEKGIWRMMYFAVDIFFFLSAVSIGKNDNINFKSFLVNRIKTIYLPFVIMSLIAFFYKSWTFIKLVKVIAFIELFQKGGGAFLWFIPGIMIFYLLSPLFIFLKKKCGVAALFILIASWAILAILLQFLFNYTVIFILLNRLPVYAIGLFFEDMKKVEVRRFKLAIVFAIFLISAVLLYKFGATTKLSKPIKDIYYLFCCPLAITTAIIFNCIAGKIKLLNSIFRLFGNVTLELYSLQMIFGYDFEMRIMKLLNRSPLSFLLVLIILLAMSYGFYGIRFMVRKLLKSMAYKKKE